VPLYNLMEDAATAEIARTQLWQWIHHPQGVLDSGDKITKGFVRQCLDEEMARFVGGEDNAHATGTRRWREAEKLIGDLTLGDEFIDFLTLPAYDCLVGDEGAPARV